MTKSMTQQTFAEKVMGPLAICVYSSKCTRITVREVSQAALVNHCQTSANHPGSHPSILNISHLPKMSSSVKAKKDKKAGPLLVCAHTQK